MERLVEDFTPGRQQAVHRAQPHPRRPRRAARDQGGTARAQRPAARRRSRPDRDLRSTAGRDARGGDHRRRADDAVEYRAAGCVRLSRWRRRGRRARRRSPDLARALASPEILQGLHALAAKAAKLASHRGERRRCDRRCLRWRDGARPGPGQRDRHDASAGDFPDLDPLMALGSSTPLFNTLGHWQQLDLPAAIAATLPTAEGDADVLPLNLVPYIRAAIAEQVDNPADRVTMDVIGLLFDYVFGDPSIPARTAPTVRPDAGAGRQGGVARPQLLQRPGASRRGACSIASPRAPIGATGDETYRAGLRNRGRRGRRHRMSRFRHRRRGVRPRRPRACRLSRPGAPRRRRRPPRTDVASALAAEQGEADRSHVLAFVRDRLTGLDLPFEVRSFVETVWADYLAAVRKASGEAGSEWTAAVGTLDDLLWSIVAKERTGQKARMTRLIPTLIGALRRGCVAVGAPPERTKPFFDALYPLHIAALRPGGSAKPGAAARAAGAPAATPAPRPRRRQPGTAGDRRACRRRRRPRRPRPRPQPQPPMLRRRRAKPRRRSRHPGRSRRPTSTTSSTRWSSAPGSP